MIARISIIVILTGMLITCSHPDTNFNITSCLANKYTPNQLSFFSKVGFKSYKYIRKWNEDITISFKSGGTRDDSTNLVTIITELRPLIYPIGITYTASGGKMQITIDSLNPKHSTHNDGLTTTNFPGEYIEHASIWLDSRQSNTKRKQALRHELMHALGLVHPATYSSGENSQIGYFMFRDRKQYKLRDSLIDGYTSFDKVAIQILYQKCLPAGLSRGEFEKQLYLLKGNVN